MAHAIGDSSSVPASGIGSRCVVRAIGCDELFLSHFASGIASIALQAGLKPSDTQQSAHTLGAGCRRFESCHPDCKTSQSSTDISAAHPRRLFYCLQSGVRKRCEKPFSQSLLFARLLGHPLTDPSRSLKIDGAKSKPRSFDSTR